MKKIFSGIMAAVIAFSSAAAITVSAAEENTRFPIYKRTDAFTSGVQGTGGWYFMYENSSGEYVNMTYSGNFNGGGASFDKHFMVPGYDVPVVLAWEAPYTGTVTLTEQENTVYRAGTDNVGNPTGGDVTATLKLNDTILTDDSGKQTHWVFDNTCYNGNGNQTYTVTGLHVDKGDVLYHKVDCGENNTGSSIYWKPVVTYTECEIIPDAQAKFQKTEAHPKGVQGYQGWYFYKKDTTNGYVQLKWNSTENQFESGDGTYVQEHYAIPGNNAPAVIAWKAPYTGTVTLSHIENIHREGSEPSDTNPDGGTPTGGDIKATIELNNINLWSYTFDKTCYNGGDKTTTYNISNVHVNKGDVIYHEVDCGTNTAGNYIYWKPIVTYTEMEVIPDKTQTVYQKTDSYPVGVQGYHGWYYLNRQQGSSEYANLNWNGSSYTASNEAYVDEHFIMGGNNAPTAIAWKAPYSGTVKLYEDSYIVYRGSANTNGADVTAAIKINNKTVTLDNGEAAKWTFTNECDHDNGSIAYIISNLHVNKGDIIYHEVDCGTNPTAANIFWKPIVEYTAFDNTSYTQTTSPAITGSDDDKTGFVTTINAVNDISISNIRWNVTSGERTKLLTPTGSLPISTLETGASVSFKVIVNGLKDAAATAVAVVE